MNDEHFDKKLLTLLILVFLAVSVSPSPSAQFAIHCVDTLNGALLGIITGKYLALHNQTPPQG